MSKLISFRNAAIVMTAVTLVSAAEVSASGLLNSDQDGVQDPDRMCDLPRDCNRVVDPQIEPGQDEPVKTNKVVDPHFKPEREPDSERLIDPDIDPVEDPEENPIIDPPEKSGPDSKGTQNRLNVSEWTRDVEEPKVGVQYHEDRNHRRLPFRCIAVVRMRGTPASLLRPRACTHRSADIFHCPVSAAAPARRYSAASGCRRDLDRWILELGRSPFHLGRRLLGAQLPTRKNLGKPPVDPHQARLVSTAGSLEVKMPIHSRLENRDR